LALQGSTGSYYDADNQYLVVSVPVTATQDGEEVILGVLVISKAMTYIQTNQEYFQSVAIIYMLSLALLSVTVAFVFSNHAFHPFQKLKKSIEDVNNGITQEVAVEDYTEFAEASEQINGLLNQMRIVDESRQEFVSNVSHELKTPLTSMKVLADSLNGQENVPVELYREFMADIGDEIDRETKIINSLLSLVKMDKAAASLNIASVNMNELIELILKRLRPIAEKQQVEVVLESFRPVTAEVDEVKISLAITNLVENGIKYNEPGGWVHVSLNADHQYCYLKVEDSGMGIPQESLDHIFERFYRVDKSHSREIGGTGLGLAITRSAVVMHKGAIKVHSVEGQGTTFDVRIPLKYIAKEEP
jgi:signal transduction histidine kinase